MKTLRVSLMLALAVLISWGTAQAKGLPQAQADNFRIQPYVMQSLLRACEAAIRMGHLTEVPRLDLDGVIMLLHDNCPRRAAWRPIPWARSATGGPWNP